jgi:hypothetical protein
MALQTAVCALNARGASVLAANLGKFSEFYTPFVEVKLDQKAFRRTKRPTPTAGPNIDANTNIRKDVPAIPRNPARYLPVLGRFTVALRRDPLSSRDISMRRVHALSRLRSRNLYMGKIPVDHACLTNVIM